MDKRYALVLLAGLIIGFQPAWGQSANTGAIVGTISDPSGGIVSGANIEVNNPATGISRSAVSDEHGNYRVEALPPQIYVVRARASGFKEEVVNDVTLLVDQVRRVDVKMDVGQVQQTVMVEGGAVAVDTETSAIGEVVTSSKVADLPLNGREFIALAALVPGAQNNTDTKSGTVQSRYLSKGYTIGFNGARAGYNSYNVDGADSVDTDTNQLIASPPLDAVQEFRVETNMYSAQQGRAGGAVLDITTKSGTNQFHGSVYEYYRDKALDALPFFYTGTRYARPAYLRNQFGASVGGRIIKDKTFFFFSPEFLRAKLPGSEEVGFSPTALERTGNVSQTINPYTGQPVVLMNPYTNQVIPSGVLPQNLITPVGAAIMASLPAPNYNDPGGLNYRDFLSGTQNSTKYMARIDHHFNDKNSLSGLFNYQDADSISPGGTSHTSDILTKDHDRTVTVGYTRIISPAVLNDFRFSYTWYKDGQDFSPAQEQLNLAKKWGLWTENLNAKGVPAIALTGNDGDTTYIGNYGIPNTHNNTNLILKDNFSWGKGAHGLYFGGDFLRQNYNWIYDLSSYGAYFIGDGDGQPGANSTVTGSVFTSLLMGLSHSQLYSTAPDTPQKYVRNVVGLWVGDDWKVTPRLTINLGLRYDNIQPFANTNGNFATFDYQTGEVRFAKNAPADRVALAEYPYETNGPNAPYSANNMDFSPRVGFALRPFGDSGTAIRAGYGIFKAAETAQYTTYGSWVVPFGGFFSFEALPAQSFDGVERLAPISQTPPDIDAFLGASPGLFAATTPREPTTYMQHYNLAIEREFIQRRLVGEVDYVGEKGTNLSAQESLLTVDPAALTKVTQVYGQAWGGPFQILTQNANSKFNSLQAKLKGQFGEDLNFLAAYNWGHAMAEASNEEFNDNTVVDQRSATQYVSSRHYSLADFDIRNRFVISGGYRLPFGRSRKFGSRWGRGVDAVLGGWEAHWILTLQSGFPWTVVSTSGYLPDRVCNGNLPASQRTPNEWFNYNCFVNHPPTLIPNPLVPGTTIATDYQGDSGTNIIEGPGTKNLDFGLHKNFSITEAVRAEFRVEAFDALNHPNLQGFSSYSETTNTPDGAEITRSFDPRDIQLALKIFF